MTGEEFRYEVLTASPGGIRPGRGGCSAPMPVASS